MGGESGGTGPGIRRASDMTESIDLDRLVSSFRANESNLGGSGGDIKLLMSQGFLESGSLEDVDAMMDL
jgi:hypothetical protein